MNKHQHKRTFLIWLSIYPLITVLFYALGGWIKDFPLPLKTLVLTAIAVPIVSYILLPFYHKIFSKWLNS
jgi:antibiotic biosynthesis monooxygenase (ABM) superfamily enzyme